MKMVGAEKLLSKIPILSSNSEYINWERQVKLAFEANDIDEYLTTKPTEKTTKEDKVARGYLLNSLSVAYQDEALQRKTTTEVWEYIKSVAGVVSDYTAAEMLAEFYGKKIGSSERSLTLSTGKRSCT